MEGKGDRAVIQPRKEWKKVVNKNGNSDSRKYQTTARFSKPVFKHLQRVSEQTGSSLAKQIRKYVRKGIEMDHE